MSLDRLKLLIGKIETDYCDETAFELSEAVDRLEYELEANAKLRKQVAAKAEEFTRMECAWRINVDELRSELHKKDQQIKKLRKKLEESK